jgi:hypothetical protein
LRADAITWFKHRFGFDFTGTPYDNVTGTTVAYPLVLLPIAFAGSGKYRVELSTDLALDLGDRLIGYPAVHLVEFTVSVLAPTNVTGTLGASSPGGYLPVPAGAGLAYGLYQFCGAGTTYDTLMKSLFVSVAGPNSQFLERFLLRSNVHGDGAGVLDISSSTATVAPFSWRIYNSWVFPASSALLELYAWDQ